MLNDVNEAGVPPHVAGAFRTTTTLLAVTAIIFIVAQAGPLISPNVRLYATTMCAW